MNSLCALKDIPTQLCTSGDVMLSATFAAIPSIRMNRSMAVMMTNRLLAVVIAVAVSNALAARAAYASRLDLPAAGDVPTIALRAAQAVAYQAQGVLDSRVREIRAAQARQEAMAQYRRDERPQGAAALAGSPGNRQPASPSTGDLAKPNSPAGASTRAVAPAEKENERESGESSDREAKDD